MVNFQVFVNGNIFNKCIKMKVSGNLGDPKTVGLPDFFSQGFCCVTASC